MSGAVSLSSADARYSAEAGGERVGTAVAGACDIDGDGLADGQRPGGLCHVAADGRSSGLARRADRLG